MNSVAERNIPSPACKWFFWVQAGKIYEQNPQKEREKVVWAFCGREFGLKKSLEYSVIANPPEAGEAIFLGAVRLLRRYAPRNERSRTVIARPPKAVKAILLEAGRDCFARWCSLTMTVYRFS
jgi:hypothetical protein